MLNPPLQSGRLLMLGVAVLCSAALDKAAASTPKLDPYASAEVSTQPHGNPSSRSDVQISFAEEDSIYVSWAERSAPKTNTFDKDQTARLFVRRFTLRGGSLAGEPERIYNASSLDDSISLLPSGGILVNANGNLTYSPTDGSSITVPLLNVCESKVRRSRSSDQKMHTNLLVETDSLSLMNIDWRSPGTPGGLSPDGIIRPPRPGKSESYACWFNPRTLSPVKTVTSRWFPNGSVSGFTLYAGPPGYEMAFTPEGEHNVPISPKCKSQRFNFLSPRLLHFNKTVATVCANGLVIDRDGKTFGVDADFSKGPLPILVSDARSAPVVALAATKVRLATDTLQARTHLIVMNYETKQVREVSLPPVLKHGELTILTPAAVALSNNGEFLAVSDGASLTVYRSTLLTP